MPSYLKERDLEVLWIGIDLSYIPCGVVSFARPCDRCAHTSLLGGNSFPLVLCLPAVECSLV